MMRIRIIAIILLISFVSTARAAGEEQQRSADREAIRKGVDDFINAVERGNAVQAAAHLTSGVEIIRDDSEPISGRETIQNLYTDYFSTHEPQKIVLETESLRFTSRDTAIEEGKMKTSVGRKAPASQRYRLLHVKEDGKWLLASIREWAIDESDIQELEWLIGSWHAKQPEAEIRTNYEWLGNRTFIRGNITMRQKDVTVSALQVIGVDPDSGDLKIWLFEADGGVAQGTCTRDEDTWVFQTEGLLANGSEIASMNLLTRINDDTFTWQPVKLKVDDVEIGDLPPMKVTRTATSK